jgi:parallel beta-helix repeat protein
MRIRSTLWLSMSYMVIVLFSTALPVAAAENGIRSGQSIQTAINAAAPGATVRVQAGIFHENLVIDKPLTLRGERGTILAKPANPSATPCAGASRAHGICVVGDPNARVSDVTITGFVVQGFSGSGVFGYGTQRLQVFEMEAKDNVDYGVASFAGLRSRLHDNQVRNNGEAGIYLGDSPDAEALITDNVAVGNGFGLFLRDSTNLTAADNRATGNCIGILAFNSGGGATAGGAYRIRDNDVRANNKSCPAGDAPPLSGIGIALAGTHDVVVSDNQVTDNRPSGPTIVSGGIAMFSSAPFGGADPVRNTVRDNIVLRNQQSDLYWDSTGSDNRFRRNHCRTSFPLGICDRNTWDERQT